MRPDLWLDAANTCCFATLRVSYGFNRFLEGRRLFKLVLERKLRNALNGRVQHVSVGTEDAHEVLRPASKNQRNLNEKVLNIITAYGCMHVVISEISTHLRAQRQVATPLVPYFSEHALLSAASVS